MLEYSRVARPGHIVIGHLVTSKSVFQFGIFDELTELGLKDKDHRRALLKAATITHLILRRMTS